MRWPAPKSSSTAARSTSSAPAGNAPDGGEAPGTQVETRSLFFNLPARRKFLRSENTESRNVEHQLHLQAIGHPEIAFTSVREAILVLQLQSTTELIARLADR